MPFLNATNCLPTPPNCFSLTQFLQTPQNLGVKHGAHMPHRLSLGFDLGFDFEGSGRAGRRGVKLLDANGLKEGRGGYSLD